MTTRADIVTEARQWIGTPFRHQGRQQSVGVDCAGLIICVGQKSGLVRDYKEVGYGRQPNPERMGALLNEYLDEIPLADVQDGDIYWMRFVDPMHLAFAASVNGRPTVIHSYSARGACVEHGLDDKWRKRIVKAYRFRGIK